MSRIAAFISMLLVSASALAQSADTSAAELFAAGRAAFERKDYRAAARAFEHANVASPRAGARYNAAIAWELAGEPAQAADAYESAKAELVGEEKTEAMRRLAALAPSLGVLVLTVAPELSASVAHVAGARGALRVHLAPGTHVLRWTDAGKSYERAFSIEARETRTLTVEKALAVSAEATARTPTTLSQPPTVPMPVKPESEPIRDASGSSLGTIGWGLTGAGGALLLGGGIVGLLTLSKRSSYLDECGGGTNCSDREAFERAQEGQRSASTLRTVSSLLLVTGAVVGAAGIGFVLFAPKPGASTAFQVGPGTIWMRTRF
jgi:tetratricopeptide (TPR) repeat protein